MKSFLQKNRGASTYQTIALTFVALITFGTVLLMLPMASQSGASLSFLDALFTATSASCVTGLIVVDTGKYFSTFGQMVIIMLIQLGGLGLMTIATLFSVAFGKKINLQERLRIQESLNESEITGVVKMCLRIFRLTIFIEFVFGTLLAWHFYSELGMQGIYFGYWHAVSAFCNAGFDLFGNFDSLTGFITDVPVNLIITSLIILGSMGFNVIEDVIHTRNFSKCHLHTKLSLITTAALIIIGTVVFFFLEQGNTLANLSMGNKILASYFQSITPRTAGFNTVDLGQLRIVTILFTCVLMFIGASPASTGGGVKTTTFALVVLSIRNMLHDKHETVIFGREIDQSYTNRAFVIVSLGFIWVVGATLLVANFETAPLDKILFEVVSAFATVGLSTGLSQHICSASKVVLIVSMFAGRVGILTFAMALTSKYRPNSIRYPKEKIMIG
jgi:trk system potassium uptake protein TrkH